MKKIMSVIGRLILLAALNVAVTSAMAQEQIEINKNATALIPISISGFSGESLSALTFDLSVLGFKVTSESPQYTVTGSESGNLRGSLSIAGGSTLFSREYSGGGARAQAHSLADDIVKQLRQTTPIFHSKIAFICQMGRDTEVYVSDFDGHAPVQLSHDSSLVDGPTWIPGVRGLLYSSWKSGTPEILEHDLSTGTRRVLVGKPGSNLSPAVSKDGRRLAMILSQGGSPNLWVSDIDGSNLKQLTQSREEDSSPTWSPDGSQICYVHRSGRASLRIIRADGGPSIPLRVAGVVGANATAPDWSPDGKQIAFTVGSGNFTIYVVPADGGAAQPLVAGEEPCWAPNSRTIVFTRRTREKRILCLLDVPTKAVKDVRQISGSCSEPSWAR